MRRRLIELGKDILIALLTLTILILLLLALPAKTLMGTPWLAAVVKPFAGLFGMNEAELTYVPTAVPAPSAAQPLAISVRNEAGRCSAVYDAQAVDEWYETLGALLAQALDTASAPVASSQDAAFSALGAPSAAFSYSAALRADVLAAWLNASCESAADARWFILAAQDGVVNLYLVAEQVSVCQTQLQEQTLLAALSSFTPDGSFFAFEAGSSFSRVNGLSLLPQQPPSVCAVQAENPCDVRFTTALAAAVGFNPYGDARYTDAAGNVTYTETDCTLRVSSDGEVLLKAAQQAQPRFAAESDTPLAQIEAARSLLSRMAQDSAGDAGLYLSSYEQTPDGAVCTFDYILDGVAIRAASGAAAEVTFTGRSVCELRVQLRRYTRQTQTLPLLPAAQAAAIVPRGQLLTICYADSGAELQAGWIQE